MTDDKQTTRGFFSQREQAQIAHAIDYAASYSDAGVPGHSQFMLIAKLFHMLEANIRHGQLLEEREQACYEDRNQAVMLVTVLAEQLGLNAGVSLIPEDHDWPVVYLDLPTGQVSWHLPADTLVQARDWPIYSPSLSVFLSERSVSMLLPWDGHSLAEKRQRIAQFLERN